LRQWGGTFWNVRFSARPAEGREDFGPKKRPMFMGSILGPQQKIKAQKKKGMLN